MTEDLLQLILNQCLNQDTDTSLFLSFSSVVSESVNHCGPIRGTLQIIHLIQGILWSALMFTMPCHQDESVFESVYYSSKLYESFYLKDWKDLSRWKYTHNKKKTQQIGSQIQTQQFVNNYCISHLGEID